MKKRAGLSVILIEDTTMFKLYDTVILSTNGIFLKLNTGGYKTDHTKNCMNDNLPKGYNVYKENYEWFVNTPNQKAIEFVDEMILTL